MPTMCIQCAMRAMLEDQSSPMDKGYFDETPEEHMQRVHRDPVKAREERIELERQLNEKLRRVKT